jgi:hypothetical protein
VGIEPARPHHVYGRTDTTTEDKSRSEIHEETNPVPKRRCDKLCFPRARIDLFIESWHASPKVR